MRAGIDGLSLRIQATLGRSPRDGSAYAFANRRRNRLKMLVWDGTGVWLCQRRAASRSFHMAQRRQRGLYADGRAMAMVGNRRGLAAFAGGGAGALAGMSVGMPSA